MSQGTGPRRRIHVEGAPKNWSGSRPATPPGPPARPGHGTPATSPPSSSSPSPSASATRIAHNAEATQSRIAGLWGRVVTGREQLTTLSIELMASAAEELTARRESSATSGESGAAQAQARHDEDVTRLASELQTSVRTLAPGAWSDDLTSAAPAVSGPAQFCRIGTYAVGEASVVALHSLFDGPGWRIAADYDHTQQLIREVVLRCLSEIPLRHLSITVFDPRLRGALGELTAVRKVSPGTFPPPIQDGGNLCQRLEDVLADAAHNAESVVAAGVATLGEKWRSSTTPSGRVNVVIVLDWPIAVDETAIRRLAALTSVNGSTGTILLVHQPPGTTPSAESQRLLDSLSSLTWARTGWNAESGPQDLVARPDSPPGPDSVKRLLGTAEAALTTYSGETLRLERIIAPDIASPWTVTANHSLDARIGDADGLPLVISLRTENPPHPNLLLGGAVGQGKSNLMLSLIYALATKYSPAELELYLLDFKQGLEFKRFAADECGEGWLPHIRALSLESSQEFGLAVLRHIENEMTQRSVQFKGVGATRIDAFRELSTDPMPRLVLVIDEFHVLFDGDDAQVDEAVASLERLAKQGRAYGIHVVLGSQTVSGMRALATRGDAIFAQFPLRVSLKNTAAESQAILSQGNSAAADLTYRGEVIVNRNFGSDPVGSNVRGLVAYTDPDVFHQVQKSLWERSHAAPPLVFVGSEAAAWDRAQLVGLRDAPREGQELMLWLGRPVALTKEPYRVIVTDDVDQTIAVVGPSPDMARAALESAVATAVLSLGSGASVTVLDGSGDAGAPWFARVADVTRAAGVALSVVPREEIASTLLGEISHALDADQPTRGMVVALGLQRVRGMDAAAPPSEGEALDPYALPSFEEPVTPRTVLRRLATDGALAGLPLIAWWPNMRALENDLGPTCAGVRAFVTAELGLEDLRTIGGPHVRGPHGSPRLGVFDRLGSGQIDVVVPFGPLTEELRP